MLTYSGYYELGIAEVWQMIDEYFDFVHKNGYFETRRRQQSRYWMFETIDEQLRRHFYDNPDIARMLEEKRTPRALQPTLVVHRRARHPRPLFLRKINSHTT